MDLLLLLLGLICIIVGFIGSIIPGLPGPPISLLGLFILHLTKQVAFSQITLIILGGLVILSIIMDYVIPSMGTKWYGGSKWGIWGSILGMVVGIFFGLMGVILGPLLGAFLFELFGGKRIKDAFRSGWGSFLGLLLGMGIKLIICGICSFFFFRASFEWLKQILIG